MHLRQLSELGMRRYCIILYLIFSLWQHESSLSDLVWSTGVYLLYCLTVPSITVCLYHNCLARGTAGVARGISGSPLSNSVIMNAAEMGRATT